MKFKIAQAAFKATDGKVVGTGCFHNVDELPADFEIKYEGFITEDGQFLTRQEATQELHVDHPVQSEELDLIKSESEYALTSPETDGIVYTMRAIHAPTGKPVAQITYAAQGNRLQHSGYHQIKTAEVSAAHRSRGIYSKLLTAASQHVRSLGGKGLVSEGAWRSPAATGAWNKLSTGNPHVQNKQGDFTLSEEELTKMQTTPVFPKLGLPDNRRETPIVTTKQQVDTKKLAIANATSHASGQPDRLPKIAADTDKVKAVGHTASTKDRNLSYATGNQLRAKTERGQHPNSPMATQAHEDLHLMFNRVGSKFGNKARMNLAHNLYEAVPKEHRDALHHYVASRYGGRPIDSKMFHEEHLAGLLNYLNNPAERDSYHKEAGHTDEHRLNFSTKMKQAYRSIRNASSQADQNWTSRIMKKSEFDELNKALEWQPEDVQLEMANDLLHIYNENLPEFIAARYLASGVTPSDEQIQESLIEHEGDHQAAALAAYGLDVTDDNIVLLRKILKQMSLEKDELSKALNFPMANKPPSIKPLAAQPSLKPPSVSPVAALKPAMPTMEQHQAPALHTDVNSFLTGLKGLSKEGPARGKFITAHMNHGPFLAALQNHPQGKQISQMLNTHLNSASNAGFKAGSAKAVVKDEESLTKSEDVDTFAIPHHIKPYNDASIPFVAIVQQAQLDKQIAPVKLNGKHSAGASLLRDAKEKIWFLKPGSGGISPARGIAEESASQARREVAFNNIGRVMGLGAYLPNSALVMVDNKEVAMMEFFSKEFKTLDKYKRDPKYDLPSIFTKFVSNGLLYKWAAMDYLLGQTDRHFGNMMMDEGHNVRFIDAGSTFAGPSFDPGRDPKSFVPCYLRVFSLPRRWNILTPEEKYKTMPKLDPLSAESLKHWVDTLSEGQIIAIMREFDINPVPFIARLKALKTYAGTKSEFLAKFYSNLGM